MPEIAGASKPGALIGFSPASAAQSIAGEWYAQSSIGVCITVTPSPKTPELVTAPYEGKLAIRCGAVLLRIDTPDAGRKKTRSRWRPGSDLAERVGFEPTVRLHARLISSQVHSTTLPPLRRL